MSSAPVYLKNGQQLRVNDHVYCSPSWAVRDGTPYSVARIMEFLAPEGVPKQNTGKPFLYTRVRLAWYYRPSDVSDRPVADSRLLLAAIYSEVCDINQLRAKCHVVHRDKISDLSGWKKRPDRFYFNRLFDPYIKKEFEIIQSTDVRNIPDNIRENLVSRYEYVVAEKEVIPDLTDSLRVCGTCSNWCPSGDSVQCDRCKLFFHMKCVQPPLLAKPSRGYGWTCAPCSREHEAEVDNRQVRYPTPTGARFKSNAPAARGRGRPRKDRTQAEKEENLSIKHYKMWPFRYFGQFTVAEDTLDEEDLIFPRTAARFGQKFQANVPAAPDIDASSPLEMDQRGGDHTIEVLSLLNDMTEKEVAELEACKARLPGIDEVKSNVDWLVEVVHRFSDARTASKPFSTVNMKALTRTEKWKKHDTRYCDREWTTEEITAFEDAIQTHGPELRAVREDVGTRSMPEVVRFYGHWKSSKLGEENARIRLAGVPPAPVFKQYKTAQEESDGQQVGLSDEESSIVAPTTDEEEASYCGACRTRESKMWWKAPKGLVSDVLCDTCGTNWRKYADLNVRPTREESLPATGKRMTEKRDGTPLSGAPPSKRARTSISSRSSPPLASSVPLMQCVWCKQDGPVGKVLKCKKCKFTSHAGTCGAIVAPADVESWTCDICQNEDLLEASLNYSCLLCPKERNDTYWTETFKPRPSSFLRACKPTEGQGWVHVLCSAFIPELTYTDASRLRLVEGLSTLPAYRWTKKCRICGSAEGAIVRCNECNKEYHATCALKHDHRLGFEIQPVKSTRRDTTTIVTFKGETGCMNAVLYCKEHDRKRYDIYGICENNEDGQTALQVYVQAYKQAQVKQAHGLLRKARRLDQLLSRTDSSGGLEEEARTSEPECNICKTQFSPFFHPIPTTGGSSSLQYMCHRCHFERQNVAKENGISIP